MFTTYDEVTSENLIEILNKAAAENNSNVNQIHYLYDVYRGRQKIYQKVKEIRPEINHKICENRANEIVTFKVGYVFGEPIQYIRRGDENKDLSTLNDQMYMSDKSSTDIELAEWMHICGLGFRIVLPKPKDDEYPLNICTLDPRTTFIVKSSAIGNEPLMGVTWTKVKGAKMYSIYTKDMFYLVKNREIIDERPHPLGEIPIIEYPLNNARLGAFEIVLPLLDAINEVQSNRLDDLVQYVNSFLAIMGGELTEEIVEQINEWKMMALPEGVDAKYLSASMTQSDVQTLADSLYQNVLTICGMPNRNGGSSTSDTGSAVILRDGWETAEAQAKSIEKMFKRSEMRFLKIAISVLNTTLGLDIRLSGIDIKFARRYTDNILTKVQALGQLLDIGIAPDIAIATVGIWNDPNDVAEQSRVGLEKYSDIPNIGQETEPTEEKHLETV